MTFTMTRCNDKARWDNFVGSSKQGSLFCLTTFLDSLDEDYELLFVEDNGRPLLGAVLLKRDGQPLRAPYPLTMYQGVMFSEEIYLLPHHTRIKRALEITDFLLAELESCYDRISFCLHYHFEDLRSFSWFHYHEPARGLFNIELRYSGILDLRAVEDFDQYLDQIRILRRREYIRAQSKGFFIEESVDLDVLNYLHSLTFERQGLQRNDVDVRLLQSIAKAAVSRGFGQMLICKDDNGNAASATLFLYDSRSGYYLIGANHPEYRTNGAGTYLMLENIRRCKEKGLCAVDFVGINSPNRGDFKISFNAAPVPYFVATWERR